MNFTEHYKLKQPELDDYVIVGDFNENADIIDKELKKVSDFIEEIGTGSESLADRIVRLEKEKANKVDVDKELNKKSDKNHSHSSSDIYMKGGDYEPLDDYLLRTMLKLGESASTAFRGDHGKYAYDHARSKHAPTDAYSKYESDKKIQELRDEAITLGESASTAFRGDRGKLAYDHSRSKHADPNAITESQARELLKSEVKTIRIKGRYNEKNYWDLLKIDNVCFATINVDDDGGDVRVTIPAGFRPKEKIQTVLPTPRFDSTYVEIKTDGTISGSNIENGAVYAIGGSTLSWEV